MAARMLRLISFRIRFQCFSLSGSDRTRPLGYPHRTQRKRVDVVDRSPGGENHLDTAAADVHYRGGASFEVEVASGAAERQLGLFLSRDDVDLNLVASHDFATEGRAVGGLPHRTGGDGPELGDLKSVGDGLHLSDGGHGPFDRLVGQAAGAIELLTQADHLPVFVQNPVGAVGLDLGHDQPNRVGPYVNGTQPRLARGLSRGHTLGGSG